MLERDLKAYLICVWAAEPYRHTDIAKSVSEHTYDTLYMDSICRAGEDAGDRIGDTSSELGIVVVAETGDDYMKRSSASDRGARDFDKCAGGREVDILTISAPHKKNSVEARVVSDLEASSRAAAAGRLAGKGSPEGEGEGEEE